MAKDRADARWAWMLFIAGLAALSLLLVPDIALYAVCGHIVRALVSFFHGDGAVSRIRPGGDRFLHNDRIVRLRNRRGGNGHDAL